jgi:rhodanese-related sulfurtransferase
VTDTLTALHPQRLALRLPLAAPVDDLEPAIAVFHRCIQRGWLEGALIDVADYRHVPQGPGVMIVGHDLDYSLTHDALTVTRKRSSQDDAATQARDLLRAACVFLEALAYDGTLDVRVHAVNVQVLLLDRALAAVLGTDPDDLEASPGGQLARAIQPTIDAAFAGEARVSGGIEHPDPRAVWRAVVQTSTPISPAEVVARLGGSRAPMQSPYDITVEEFAERRGQDGLVVLDVREESEYETVNLGGTLIPLAQLPDRLDELDRDATVLVHCRAGSRGGKATVLLREAGFADAWNVNGALVAWADRIDPSTPRY